MKHIAPLGKTWEPPKLEKWQEERQAQCYFDFLIPTRQPWLPTSQAARFLHCSTDSILNLAEAGRLETEIKQYKGERKELNISRRSLLLHRISNMQLDPRELEIRAVEFVHSVKCRRIVAAIKAACIKAEEALA